MVLNWMISLNGQIRHAGAYRVFHGKGTQDEHALLAEALGERAPQLLAYAQGQIERKFRYYD